MKYFRNVFFMLIVLFFCKNNSGQELVKKVDEFVIDGKEVEVFFNDPTYNVPSKYPDFLNIPDSESKKKSDIWSEYLHNSILYTFKVKIENSDDVLNYIVRGDPGITNSKMFYKVDVLKSKSGNDFDPNTDDYIADRTIDKVNCGGTLFENMAIFDAPENKGAIGNGIQFFGYYRRVQPYQEIKNSMIYIIEKDIKENYSN